PDRRARRPFSSASPRRRRRASNQPERSGASASAAATPDDLKPIIMEVCGNPFRTSGGLNAEVYETMMKEIESKGVQLHKMPADQEARWFELFQEETRKWVGGLEDKGLPAKEAVKAYNEIAKKHGVEVVSFPPEYAK
ncbi:MAG: hypothetical protein R6X07_08955, partial [Desulfatiglandales bacterium]